MIDLRESEEMTLELESFAMILSLDKIRILEQSNNIILATFRSFPPTSPK
jgi:hypothetical protein